jgi:rod shape-determining protein MreD
MTVVVHCIVGYLLFGLEAALLHHLEIPFHAPDLGAVIAVYLGFTQAFAPGILCALVLGFLQDGFSMGAPVGIHAVSLVTLFLLSQSLSTRLTMRSGIPLMIVAFVAAAIAQTLLFAMTAVFDQRIEQYGMLMEGWFVNALIASPFGPIVFWLMDRSDVSSEKRQRSRVFFDR